MTKIAPETKKDQLTLFGLPTEVQFCVKCSYSNQKPNSAREFVHSSSTKKETVEFDANGVCSACRVADAKKM